MLFRSLSFRPEIIGSFFLLAVLDVLVHFLIDLKQALFELNLLSELLCCARLRVHFLGPGLVFSLVCILLEQCTTLHLLLVELVHFTPLLFLKPLRDEVRLGAITLLGVFDACVDPRREVVVVESATWLVGMLLVLRSPVAELLDQLLPVVKIGDLRLLVEHVPMGHLSSLDFGDIMLPSLLYETNFVVSYLSPEAAILHLLVLDSLLFYLFALSLR